jgi:hypothetical protein
MKKILAIIVSYLGLFSGLYAYEVPFQYPPVPQSQSLYNLWDIERVGRSSVGYLELKWGSSSEHLFKLYPECEEITDEIDEARGIQRYIEEVSDSGIESRQFVYYQDKLYEVYVLYGYVDEQTSLTMQQKLELVYGPVFAISQREVRSDGVLFKMVDRYIDFNWDLQIIFTSANVYDDHNYKLGTTMTCLYVNRELKSEAERPRLNLRPEPRTAE